VYNTVDNWIFSSIWNPNSRATHKSNMVLSRSCVTQASGKTPAGGFKRRRADVSFSPCYYYYHYIFSDSLCMCVCMRFISGARQVTEGTTLITRCRDLSYYYYYRLIHQLGVHYTKRIFTDDHDGGGCVNSCACICFRQSNTVRRPWPRKLYVWVLLLFVLLLLLLCCYVKSRRECAGIAFSNCPLDAHLECLDISHRLWNQNNIISVL